MVRDEEKDSNSGCFMKPNRLYIFLDELGIILGKPILDAFEAAFIHRHYAVKDKSESYTIIIKFSEPNENRNCNIPSAREFATYEEAVQALTGLYEKLEGINHHG